MPAPSASDADAYAYSKTLKIYPLSQASNPAPTRFVNLLDVHLHTLPFYDIRALQDIHDIISVEPVRPQDKVMMGMLATIGIEPRKPFNPQGELKAAMEKGIVDAYFYMQQLDAKLVCVEPVLARPSLEFCDGPRRETRVRVRHVRCRADRQRAAAWFFFTWYPKLLTEHAGTVYLAPTADQTGQPLEAGKTYRLRVPKDVPARRFGRSRCTTMRHGLSSSIL